MWAQWLQKYRPVKKDVFKILKNRKFNCTEYFIAMIIYSMINVLVSSHYIIQASLQNIFFFLKTKPTVFVHGTWDSLLNEVVRAGTDKSFLSDEGFMAYGIMRH